MCTHCQKAEAEPRRTTREAGVTLIELMVTLSIMAILLGIAMPSIDSAMVGSKVNSYANSLVASSNAARSEAIKRNTAVTMCVSADGASCSSGGWEQGWIVLAGTDVIVRQEAASNGFRLTGTVSSISFQPTGVGATQTTITVCRATPTAGAQERVVSISATGRASTARTHTGVCS
ncbi:MAG TPA: GspH/FimT family pseudopilin [Noviherbaspirillum sp.]|nr:GspH/FimT family pseudopilin [Noviherbaspirillum sp.]